MRRNQQLMQHRYFNYWDNAWALATSALSGVVGGGVSGMLGNNIGGVLGAGFAGGATGSMMNGAEGWDILYGGVMGAGIAGAVHTGMWAYGNFLGGYDREAAIYAELTDADVPRTPDGSRLGDAALMDAADDFIDFHSKAVWENGVEGESIATYSRRKTFFSGREYYKRIDGRHFQDRRAIIGISGKTALVFHSQPNHAFPSAQDYYQAEFNYNNYKVNSYLLAPDNTRFFGISPNVSNPAFYEITRY